MLKEKRATTLTQFLVTRLVIQGGEEADGTMVRNDEKLLLRERELCLLKEIAEGTYKSKHAEAARLDYTTTQRHIQHRYKHEQIHTE